MKRALLVTFVTALPTVAFAADLGGASGPAPETGMALGSWLVYPQLFAGFVFNDNVSQSSTQKKAELGFRLAPSFQAQRDDGVHKTFLFGAGDLQFYRDGSASNQSQGRIGIAHEIDVMSDLTLRGGVNFARSTGLPTGLDTKLPVIVNSTGNAPGTGQAFNQWSGSVAVEKKFTERFFVIASGNAQKITNDDTRSGVASSQNSTTFTTGLRTGYWISPIVNAFVDTSVDWREYHQSSLNSHGYRVTGGLASDQIGLMRGEVYGGYQQELGASAMQRPGSSPVVGGRLFYFPTEYLTFALSADQTLGANASPVPGQSSYTRNESYQLATNYTFSPYWNANARVALATTRYVGLDREDKTFVAGAGLSYTFWRNIALTADVQHTQRMSTLAAMGYTQNLYTLGATYRY